MSASAPIVKRSRVNAQRRELGKLRPKSVGFLIHDAGWLEASIDRALFLLILAVLAPDSPHALFQAAETVHYNSIIWLETRMVYGRRGAVQKEGAHEVRRRKPLTMLR